MKRSIVLLAVLLMAAMPFRMRQVLERSLLNEREAVARYEAYAQKATEEGYLGAASLFRAAARAEGVHAERFAEALRERGVEVSPAPAFHPTVGTTAENLRGASMAELQERDTMYRDAIDAARDAKDQALLTVFDQTRDTEVEHANLLAAALRQLDQFKSGKTYYVCDRCGYTTDFAMPLCALCRLNKRPHEVH